MVAAFGLCIPCYRRRITFVIVPAGYNGGRPLADPEVGFVTPTQAGDLVTPPQARSAEHAPPGGAHQVPFNLDEAPHGLEAVHVHFNDLGEPYDPAAPKSAPLPAPLIAAAAARLLR